MPYHIHKLEMYTLCNNSGVFARIWPLTFYNDDSDIRDVWGEWPLHGKGMLLDVDVTANDSPCGWTTG
jgi:hypothetical protein